MLILKIKGKNKADIINSAAGLLKKGGVVVFPTDTVYGLIADATNKKATEKVFKIKKRDKNKPLPIFVKDIEMAKEFAIIKKEHEKFLKKVWPGKVTAVLIKKRQKNIYGLDNKTIAIRIPKHNVISKLLSALGRPLTGTSANISGKPASGKVKDVIRQFKNEKAQPDLTIDAGNLPENKPSQIIDLTGDRPKILRN
jgi:L-threonylcarbamoyladenylate synthase